MPNDCWSNLTITASKTELVTLLDTEFKYTPEWALKIEERGKGGIRLSLWSAWVPDLKFLENLIEKYPSCWIKNIWSEEGGTAGVWIGTMRTGVKDIKQLTWDDMCEEELFYRFETETELKAPEQKTME
jgi:hypothetical protein